jgi:pseudouridine synthase
VTPGHDKIYVLLNKPAGYLVTSSDPQGRPTVFDLLEGLDRRIFSVGRLDQDTEGVLLLTDDGDLAERLVHPRHSVIKGYQAKVSGAVDDRKLSKLLHGVSLEDGLASAKAVKLLARGSHHSEIYLELTSGKKRQVKRMCAAIGHPVIALRRTIFAGMSAGDLALGQWRYLTSRELDQLKASAAETA